jgi:hypothetical protein
VLKHYRNIGGRTVLKHKPGEEFDADIPESQEARLIKLGHLEIVNEEEPAPIWSAPEPEQEEEKEVDLDD